MAVLGRAAPTTSSASDDGGAIYIYRRAGGSWQEVNILRTNQTNYHAHTIAMSSDGTRIVMQGDTITYVFDVALDANGQPEWNGTWSPNTFNNGITSTYSYVEISSDGNVLVIGDSAYSNRQGRVRIYQLINGIWTYRNEFFGNTSGSDYGNGIALSSNGDVIVVGAPRQATWGRVHVYRRNGSNWASEQILSLTSPTGSDYFGRHLSLNAAGDRIAIGAPRNTINQALLLSLITMAATGVKLRYCAPVMVLTMTSMAYKLN
ncbi:probable outer membrane secretion protein [Vibrio ponticus]|nr:probable outer membrane secretion protein [Vibrio ponticus]